MNPNLEMDLLRTFVAVAETYSFTAAAELVARTQSAVSLQIKRLEEIVGQRLFERTSRSIELTPAGEKLLKYARMILDLNDESVRRMAEPPVNGPIRLGITEYFVPTELPRILARFAGAYPGVQLEVRMGLSRDLRQALSAGELDAAIVRLGANERDKSIWSEAQVWVCREGAEPGRGETIPLALLPAPCVLREHAIASMTRQRRQWKVTFTGSSMASVQAAVLAGLGVSIVPLSSVTPEMRVLGRGYPDPGRLDVGVVRAAGAPKDIMDALQRVMNQTLGRLLVSRAA